MTKSMRHQITMVIEHIESMSLIKCDLEDYIEGLEEIQNHIEVSLEAAKEDLDRRKEDS
jgi:hypothetical protein